MNDMRGERLQVMLSPEELATVDNFRFKHRMPTRAAAVRELLRFGLQASGIDGQAGVRCLSTGFEAHAEKNARNQPRPHISQQCLLHMLESN